MGRPYILVSDFGWILNTVSLTRSSCYFITYILTIVIPYYGSLFYIVVSVLLCLFLYKCFLILELLPFLIYYIVSISEISINR